jgi:hypothetical protein
MFSIRAYHGTPHTVDKFSTEKIGTGEGAQVYGWGLYFAQERKVAEEYKNRLTNDTLIIDGVSATEKRTKTGNLIWAHATQYFADGFRTKEALLSKLKAARSYEAERGNRFFPDSDYASVISAVEGAVEIKLGNNGNLYKVKLDVEPEDLLDWDKPLSEQSEKIQRIAAEELKRIGGGASTGERFYNELAFEARRNDTVKHAESYRIASQRMLELGIPGIRYLDQGSRVAGQNKLNARWDSKQTKAEVFDRATGVTVQTFDTFAAADKYIAEQADAATHNYVIFDESKITIEPDEAPAGQFSKRGDKAKAERDARILAAMKGKDGGKMPKMNEGRGDPFENAEPPAKLPMASRVWRGVADVFDEVKGLGFLADAIRKHVDRQRMLQGKVTAPFREWEQRYGRAARRKAEQEFEAYQRKLDQERDPDLVRDLARGKIKQTGADTGGLSSDEFRRQASEAGRALMATWDGMAERVQKRNQALNVMARGADGAWKPIGTITQYYPRSLRPDILRALRNREGNRKAYNELARELYDAGLIKDAREAREFIQTHFRTESQFDHLGNIEAARAVKMPTKLYDYTFAAARRYLLGWTERIAQIEAFGQKTTQTSKDLFDVAQDRMIGNQPVQEYIESARKLAYSERSQTAWGKALRLMNTAAVGLQLGNPITVGVNLASGLAYNASHFGYANAMRGFWELRKLGQQINDAHEAGGLLDDLMGIAEDARGSGSKLEEAAAAMTRGLLSVSGYNASETFVRAHGYATARAFLRQYLKDTKNGQFRRFFERNKLNADKLATEAGTGPETDRFLRRAVTDAQGGYRYDQVPVFTDTPIGRFLFKYQKWGTQALRNFMINTSPLVGRMKDPAAWASAARYLLTTALVGAGIEGAKTALFGVSPRTAGLVEIANTLDDDEKRAWELIREKVWRSMMAAGAFGILGNYLQVVTDVAERSRFKNPLDPPGLAAVKGLGELAMTAYEQGKLTSGDALNFLGKQVSLVRVLKAAAARAVEAAGATDQAPNIIQDEATRQNLSWSAGIVRRFLDEQGVEATRTQIGRVASSPLLPYKRAVVAAIHRGDLPGGREAIAAYMARLAPQDRKAAQRTLETYVQGKQPLKVDGSTSAMREAFIRWAQRRLEPSDFMRLMRMDTGYRTTARQLGLMNAAKKPTEADLEKALQRRKQPR